MNKEKDLYLIGAVSGVEDYKQRFQEALIKLMKKGYIVTSPITFCNERWSWAESMKACIKVLITKKAVAVIEPIENSKGAQLELTIAKAFGMEIKTVEEWLENEKNSN